MTSNENVQAASESKETVVFRPVPWKEQTAFRASLNSRELAEFVKAEALATGYVWGLQDADPNTETDTLLAGDFGFRFGREQVRFMREERYFMRNTRSAWELFAEGSDF